MATRLALPRRIAIRREAEQGALAHELAGDALLVAPVLALEGP